MDPWICFTSLSIFTFSAFTCNFGFQVDHLHLKAFNVFLLMTTFTAITATYNDNDNDNYGNSRAHSNPDLNWNNLTLHLFKILQLAKIELQVTYNNLSKEKKGSLVFLPAS